MSLMNDRLVFDRQLLRQKRQRAAPCFADHAFLFDRVVDDMADRLLSIDRQFPLSVIIQESGRTRDRLLSDPAIAAKIGTCVAVDLSETMLRSHHAGDRLALVCDHETLPLAPQSVDLILAPLALHNVNDLPGALIQIRRALRPDGLFIGSLFVADTLLPLRIAFLRAEQELSAGASMRVAPLAHFSDLPGLLQRAKMALPVADCDPYPVHYSSLIKLLADLRGMGEAACFVDRSRRSLGPQILARAEEILFTDYGVAGPSLSPRFAVTFQVATLTGWAPHESQPKPLRPGSAQMRLASALGTQEVKLPKDEGRVGRPQTDK